MRNFIKALTILVVVAQAVAVTGCSSGHKKASSSKSPGSLAVPSAASPASSSASSAAPSAPSSAVSSSQPSKTSVPSAAAPSYINDAADVSGTTESICEKAFNSYSAGDYKNAILYSNAALRQDAGSYVAYNIKGIVLCFLADYKDGMPLIEKSLAINPQYDYGRFNMAMGYKLQKDYDDALYWFNKELEVKPNDAWTYYGIATIYADRDQLASALQYLQLAVNADPSVKPVAREQDHFAKYRSNPDFIRITS